MTPERVGRYRVVRELGKGGFATVYLGEDPGLDDLVAIKILSDTLAADADGVTRFVSEARVMRNLREPGVVTVHDVGEHDGLPYFVMEYCSRGALADRLDALDRPLTVSEGVGLAKAIGDAVGGMHQATPPVVHRDIKPANLLIRHRPNRAGAAVGELLGGDEELIVGDFGLAKVVDLNDTKFTLIAYTRGFAPPEQLRGDGAIGPTADVFSASAVVTSAVSGVSPNQMFAEGDQVFEPDALAATGPLAGELARGLSYDRNRRHRTIGEWTQALVAAAAAVPPTGSPTAIAPNPAAPTRRVGGPASSNPGTVPAPRAPQHPGPPSGVGPGTGAIAPGEAAFAPASSSDSKGRRGLLMALGAVAVAALAGIGGFVVLATGGGDLIGPSRARVGDQVAFTTDEEFEADIWRVDGQAFDGGPVLEFMPTGAGSVEIEAVDESGAERSANLDVSDDNSSIRIIGPAVLPLDATTTIRADGLAGVTPTWVIDGQTLSQDTLDLQPSTAGAIEIELRAPDGRSVTRTFTVPPAR